MQDRALNCQEAPEGFAVCFFTIQMIPTLSLSQPVTALRLSGLGAVSGRLRPLGTAMSTGTEAGPPVLDPMKYKTVLCLYYQQGFAVVPFPNYFQEKVSTYWFWSSVGS